MRGAKDLETLADERRLAELRAWLDDHTMPVELDVGCNVGDFEIGAANTLTETRFVGIELDPSLAAVARSRIYSRGLRNVLVFSAEARDFITREVADSSIEGIHIYFPTPHFRAIGLAEPVVSTRLVAAAWRVLVPNGWVSLLVDLPGEAQRISRLFGDRRWNQVDFVRRDYGQEAEYLVGTRSEKRHSSLRSSIALRYQRSDYQGRLT